MVTEDESLIERLVPTYLESVPFIDSSLRPSALKDLADLATLSRPAMWSVGICSLGLGVQTYVTGFVANKEGVTALNIRNDTYDVSFYNTTPILLNFYSTISCLNNLQFLALTSSLLVPAAADPRSYVARSRYSERNSSLTLYKYDSKLAAFAHTIAQENSFDQSAGTRLTMTAEGYEAPCLKGVGQRRTDDRPSATILKFPDRKRTSLLCT